MQIHFEKLDVRNGHLEHLFLSQHEEEYFVKVE